MNPQDAVEAIRLAKSDEEVLSIEQELIAQTDNRPHEGDPPQPEDEDANA